MSAIYGLPKVTALEERKFDMAGCTDNSMHEDYTLELPKDMKITSLPKNTDLKTAIGTYKSSYTLDGQTLHAVRDLTLTTGTATCNPAQYKALRAFAQEVNKDLRAQVLYQ
jgi:hypothetical protein